MFQQMQQTNANNGNHTGGLFLPVAFLAAVGGLAFGFIILVSFVNHEAAMAHNETRSGKTWVAPDDRALMKESVEEKTLALLVKLAIRHHISKLDDQGACNTPEQCLSALEGIEPRFYGTEYMRRELFPRAFQEHLAIGVVSRIRAERKGADQ